VPGTIEELRRLVEGASMQRSHLTSRLEKAAFLVLLRPVRRMDGDVWRVGSEDGLRFYTVRKGECECADYLRHGSGHPCKHRLALWLHRTMEEGSQATSVERLDDVGEPSGWELHSFVAWHRKSSMASWLSTPRPSPVRQEAPR
jgi:hypothetical protein